ncbi:hypothetical protein B0T10DRAFT_481038 [Thelonectria olida]|uniref:Nephrocystin 3-like N-terminal domain-containing protein n=1 Tax=Thelonectria olida TaxID=1576542 RepID=A0A9P8WBJ6_9HYPO|nr:hypothetical protein B0T10DRAFT_481038 [Thelonectria olida]
MDPLSITASSVACLQLISSILSTCYGVRAAIHTIPEMLAKVIEEVRDLRTLIEAFESGLHKDDSFDGMEPMRLDASQKTAESVRTALARCLDELRNLESRFRPENVEAVLESKRKAFLQSVAWKLKGNEVADSIANLQQCKADLNLAISSHNSVMIQNIERLSISLGYKIDSSHHRLDSLLRNLTEAQLDEQQKAVVDWLSPLKPGQAHHSASEAHQSGTSKWFLQSKDFRTWSEGSESRDALLWLSGLPGFGKTVMMSHAIDVVAGEIGQLDDKAIYAFAYCDFRDPDSQDMVNILGTVLTQLCAQLKYLPAKLLCEYQSSTEQGQGTRPTIKLMHEAIESLAKKRRVYLFVDALDEVADCRSLAQSLVSLVDSASTIRIMATSRNEAGIRQVFKKVRHVSLEDHIPEVDDDIHRYIADRLDNSLELGWLSPKLRSLVSASLLSECKGNFQWAACQLDSLGGCRTIRDIKKSLKILPRGLNETYRRILARITPSDAPLVQKVLMWLSFSAVPITLHQLWEALAIEEDSDCIDEEARLMSPQEIMVLGNSLVTLSSDGHVMLSHLSVRDYLVSSEISQNLKTARFALRPEACHRDLAQGCLTYLFFLDLSSGPSSTEEAYLARLGQLPLLNYAAKYWFYHARSAVKTEELRKLTIRFFSQEARQYFMSWVQVFNADAPFKWNIFPRHATSLYYASSLGLDEAVEILLQSATHDELNAPGSRFGGTALHAAIIRGHIMIAERLITAGCDPGKADFNGVTPLHSAASHGSMDEINVLMNHGAPTDVRDGMDAKTPAEWAKLSGYMAAASVIEQGRSGWDPGQGSRVCTRAEKQERLSSKAGSQTVELWYPRKDYYPDYYERRSGLDSSVLLSITIGDQASHFSSDFRPV